MTFQEAGSSCQSIFSWRSKLSCLLKYTLVVK